MSAGDQIERQRTPVLLARVFVALFLVVGTGVMISYPPNPIELARVDISNGKYREAVVTLRPLALDLLQKSGDSLLTGV